MYYIYRITNLINGKTYMGKHEYKKLDDGYMGSGKALYAAKVKYGIKNFKKDILVFNIPNLKYANLLEETFIDAEREKVGRENCYNIANGGDGGNLVGGPTKGSWKKGHIPWNKGKKGCQVAWNKGKSWSDNTKLKISKSLKDKPFSDERKEQMSISRKGKHWYNNGIKEVFCFECPNGYKKGRLEMKWQKRDETGKFIKKGDR